MPLVEVSANENEAPGGVRRLAGALAKRQRFKDLRSSRTPVKGVSKVGGARLAHDGHRAFTYVLLSKAFTVVSLASEPTKFTISARMHGRRKWAAMSALHRWMEGQPAHRGQTQSDQDPLCWVQVPPPHGELA